MILELVRLRRSGVLAGLRCDAGRIGVSWPTIEDHKWLQWWQAEALASGADPEDVFSPRVLARHRKDAHKRQSERRKAYLRRRGW